MNQPSLNKHLKDYQGQIPWTYPGQGIGMEDTVEKCDEYVLQGFLNLKAHLVKLEV